MAVEKHTTKRCTQCREAKPVEQFSPRKQNKDGLYSWCKPCSAAKAKAWADKNREYVQERNKTKYWSDPEAARAARTRSYRARTGGGPAKPAQAPVLDDGGVLTLLCSKCEARKPVSDFYERKVTCKDCTSKRNQAYVDANRERVSAYKKRWIAENAEHVTRLKQAGYAANRGARIAASREWVKQNPDKRRSIAQNYKHKRRAQEEGGISTAELHAWKKAQPKVCYWCGAKCAKGSTIDHYQPLAKGGKHEASNLVIACRPCNSRKNAKDPLDFAALVGRLF